jgi:hypothetical protein
MTRRGGPVNCSPGKSPAFNLAAMFQGNAGGTKVQTTGTQAMRSNWVWAVSELVLFVAAVAFMTTGFVWIAGPP